MKTKTFILLPFIIIALFFSACTQDASQFQPDSKTDGRIKAKVKQKNVQISDQFFAKSGDDSFEFWYRQAYDMYHEDKVISDDRYKRIYKYALEIDDKNFYPDRFAANHKVNTLTIRGITRKKGDELYKVPDLVLCDSVDKDVFEIVE